MGNFMGNPINLKAVVTEEAKGVLLGIPGMENCGIDLISSKKELHFPNGTVVNYKTQTTTRAIKASQTKATTAPGPKVTSRCILLQAPPTSTWLNPGESITLTKPDTPICDGKYLIAPHPEAKGSTQEWITTGTMR